MRAIGQPSVLAAARPSPRFLAGLLVAVGFWVLVIALSDPTVDVTDPLSGRLVTAQDARSYYGLNLSDLYTGRTNWNTIGAYPYSPAFAQLVYPLNLLPWTAFVAAWTAILLLAWWWARWRSPAATSRWCSRSRSWPGSVGRGHGRSCC
jgi:hypothetical protein